MEFKSQVRKAWYEVADHLDREDVMLLLKVVLNNCIFSCQGQFYKQLHGTAMGSPCSPVVANIYMEFFEKRALDPELPIFFTIDIWLRKGTHDPLLNYLNSIDPNINFTIEAPNEHTDRYLDFITNHPKSAKCAVVRPLTDRAKNVCSSPELLAEEMDHLGKVLKHNNYPKWMIDQCGRNNSPAGRLIDPETGRVRPA